MITYTNSFYCFDTETTTFEYEGEHFTDVYLASFCQVPFNLNISKRYIEKLPVTFCRSWSDIDEMFKNISRKTPRGYVQVCYIHNASFDWDGMVKNCSFIRDNWKGADFLFVKSRKPLYIRIKNIEFRCSYLFLNQSLRFLGTMYGYEKLEIDYDSQFFSFSDLPDSEYEYNARDVKVQAYSILQECKKYPYITDMNDVPYTYTSLTRKLNQFINTRECNRSYKNRNMYAVNNYQKNIDILEMVYQGAYTHGNAYDIGKVLHCISSIDITSSYPDSMIHRDFPYNFKTAKKCVLNFFKFIYYQHNKKSFNECLLDIRHPFEYAFFGKFTLKNVKVKEFPKHLNFPTISYHKILNHPICTLDNGRIINANKIEIYLNHIDFFIFDQFYEYEVEDVCDFWYTKQFRPLHDFVLNVVRKYAHEKTIYKECVKVLKSGAQLTEKDFFCSAISDYICSEEIRKTILLMSPDEQMQNVSILLSGAKSRLNAQYGINVQRIFQENFTYNIEEDTFEHYVDRTLPRNLYRNFEEGLFITAYSRLTLFSMADFLMQYGLRPIYSDTDSWKVEGRPERIREAVENFNAIIENSAHNSELYDIGYFDYEGTFEYFSMLGAKKYICIDNSEVECTIAGVPKKRMSDIYTMILNDIYQGNVEDFCEDCFKPCTVLDYSAILKLSSKFYTNSFEGEVTDCNGKTGDISFNNMVELFKTDYTLIDANNKANADYLKFLEFVQGRRLNTDWTKISVDTSGIPRVDYIEPYKKDYILMSDYMQTLEIFEGER